MHEPGASTKLGSLAKEGGRLAATSLLPRTEAVCQLREVLAVALPAIPLILLIPPRNTAPRCEIQSSMHSIALMLPHLH
jgi:hypothetical protein